MNIYERLLDFLRLPEKKGHYRPHQTQGDVAREQLRKHGLPYFIDVQCNVKARLASIAPNGRKAFALACAERLMRWHETLLQDEQRAFTLGWRPILDTMWNDLQGQEIGASERVRSALVAYRASPYDHDDGQDGPDDADEDAAAASIAAAECFLSGDVEAAGWAAGHAIDRAFAIAGEALQYEDNGLAGFKPISLAQEAMHPIVQRELRQQIADIEELERQGVTPGLLQRWAARPYST